MACGRIHLDEDHARHFCNLCKYESSFKGEEYENHCALCIERKLNFHSNPECHWTPKKRGK
jgi:hypothetical protein